MTAFMQQLEAAASELGKKPIDIVVAAGSSKPSFYNWKNGHSSPRAATISKIVRTIDRMRTPDAKPVQSNDIIAKTAYVFAVIHQSNMSAEEKKTVTDFILQISR